MTRADMVAVLVGRGSVHPILLYICTYLALAARALIDSPRYKNGSAAVWITLKTKAVMERKR